MTGREIKALAELHTEDLPIEDDQALAFINECLFMDLGKDAGVISSEEITVSGDSWTTMQTSFLDIIEIEKNGDTYYGRKYGESRNGLFDIKSKNIRFPEAGTYTIWGHVTPTPLTDLREEPEVHELLHYPIAIYVAARAIFWDDEENPSFELKMRDYYMYKQNVLNQLADMEPTTKKSRKVRIPPFV